MFVEVVTIQYRDLYAPFFLKHYEWADRITVIDKEFENGIDDHARVSWLNQAYKASTADWIIIADADEMVFCNKEDLSNILPEHNVVRCRLHDVYRHISESDLDLNLPIKEQRRHGVLNGLYIKPCIIRGQQNIDIGLGCHFVHGNVRESQTQFTGAHLKNADVEIAIKTRINMRKNRFSDINKQNGYGLQDFNVTEESIRKECLDHNNDPEVW